MSSSAIGRGALSRANLQRICASFAFRVLVLLALATLAPLVVVLAQTQQDVRAAEQRTYQNARAVARAVELALDVTIQESRKAAESAARLPTFWQGTDADRSAILAALGATMPEYAALVYFTPDFQPHGAWRAQGEGANFALADAAAAREAVLSGQAAFTPVGVADPTTGQFLLPIVWPLHDPADPRRGGYLAAMLDVAEPLQSWTGTDLPPGSTMLLLDLRSDRILGGTGEVLRAINDVVPVDVMSPMHLGVPTYRLIPPHDHVERLRAWTPVSNTPWAVAIDSPGPVVFGPIYREAATRSGIALGIAALTLIALLLLWHQLAARLRALQTAVVHWARRDWDYRAGLRGADELGQLAVGLDGMAAQLGTFEREREQQDQARAQLAAIVESAPDAIISYTLDGQVTSWNAGAERLYGYRPEEALGHPIAHLLPPERAEEMAALWARARRGEPISQHETTRQTRDGRVIDVSLTLSLIRNANGAGNHYAEISSDISDRRALERLKDDFVSVVSHELRTPSNGVIGMTELLRQTELTPHQREYVAVTQQSGEVLLALINDILDFSKIEAGKLELDVDVLDVRHVVESVAGLLGERAARKGLELVAFVHGDVPYGLRGDAGRLHQILLNLVSNAIKFTQDGEVVLVVTEVESTPEAVVLQLEVRDTGIGIAAEARDHLFEAFRQADSSTTRQFGGTGLGLAICKRLVALMGGEIGVDSEPGLGSRFWFTARFTPAAEKPSTPISLSGTRVLAVDDNATNRSILQQQLACWKIEAATAEDGARALVQLREAAAAGRPYEVAILDMQMPRMDGLDLARAIREDATLAGTPLVLLTSLDLDVPDELRQSLGIARVLTKPVRQSQLFDALMLAIDGASTAAAGGIARAEDAGWRSVPTTVEGPWILVAEDSAINQQVASGMLESLGYRTDLVGNGREAIDALERRAYAAVLMDCWMPEMDGYSATAEIRRREGGAPRIPIIALTANAMKSDRAQCMAAGMDDYLAKPFRPEELKGILERWAPRAERPAETNAPRPRGDADPAAPPPGDAGLAPAPLQQLDPALARDLCEIVRQEWPSHLAALQEAVGANAPDQLCLIAHRLKGEAASLGASEMQGVALELEQLGQTGTVAGAEVVVERLQQAARRTIAALEDYVSSTAGQYAPQGAAHAASLGVCHGP